MEIVVNAKRTTQVHRIGEDLLKSESLLISDTIEISAWLTADWHDFTVHDAAWEIYRHPTLAPGHFRLTELIGRIGFLGYTASFIQALGKQCDPILRELTLECIRGFIQVPCLLQKEYGYASTYEYFLDYYDAFINTCLPYSSEHPEKMEWVSRPYPRRDYMLFNRVNSIIAFSDDRGGLVVVSDFNDTHQQMAARMKLDNKGVILDADAEFGKRPDKMCCETRIVVKNLIGKRLIGMKKSEIGACVGGKKGCEHMLTMIHHTALTLASVFE